MNYGKCGDLWVKWEYSKYNQFDEKKIRIKGVFLWILINQFEYF